jgi:hypothetical protein
MFRHIFSFRYLVYTGFALLMLTQAAHYFAFPFYPLVHNGGDGEIWYLVFQLLGTIAIMAGGYFEKKHQITSYPPSAYLIVGIYCYLMLMPAILGAVQDKWVHINMSGYAALGIIPLCIGILAYAAVVLKNNHVSTTA